MPKPLFNIGPLMPPDGDYDGTPTVLERVVGHPALPFAPLRALALESYEDGIPGPFLRPPRMVIASAIASQWKLNANLSAGGVPYSITDELIDLNVITGTTLGNRAQPGHAGNFASFSDQQFDGDEDFCSVTITAGFAEAIKWTADSGGLWVPGIEIIVASRKVGEVGDIHNSSYGWNRTSHDTTADPSDAIVTVCGDEITLYQSSGGTPFALTGTLTLEPSAWLTPI